MSPSAQASIDPWYLIRFNYPNLPPNHEQAAREVNWYLQEYVGCKRVTDDRKNYVFSSSDVPGYIYLVKSPADAPTARGSIPILETIKERRESIMANTPGIFLVASDANAKPYAKIWYSDADFEEVTKNLALIERYAHQYNLDPDFLKAIVWMETTHGYYDRIDPWNKTIRPMNVHYQLWSDLGLSKKSLGDPSVNIAAGAYLLAAIWERTDRPTFQKVSTLYNKLSAKTVDGYGKTIVVYMAAKPWLRRPKTK